MGKRTTRVVAVVGAAAVLVVGANVAAYAATGSSLILGKKNKASKVTTVQRTTNGPALAIKTKKSSSAPFTTNAKGKVVNLNADKVDGQSASDIRKGTTDVKAIRFKDSAVSRDDDTTYILGAVPKGTYLVNFNAAIKLATEGTPAAPNVMNCALYDNNVLLNTVARATYADLTGEQIGPSFSTVVTATGSEAWRLGCTTTAGDGWDANYTIGSFPIIIFVSGEAPTISFTKLDGVTDKTPTVAP